MNTLCSEIYNLIIEFITGVSPKTRTIIDDYFPDSYLTVPNEIRLTFLRKYLLPNNIPNDYLILPFAMKKEYSLFVSKIKLVDNPKCGDQTNKLFLRTKEIVFSIDYKTFIIRTEIRCIVTIHSFVFVINPFPDFDIQQKCTTIELYVRDDILATIPINTVSMILVNIDDIKNKINGMSKIFDISDSSYDNIQTMITNINNGKLWKYPKNLKKHIIIRNEQKYSILAITDEMRNSHLPIIFHDNGAYICIMAKYVNSLIFSSIIYLKCVELCDYGIFIDYEKTTKIDISRFTNNKLIFTHENVIVEYGPNTIEHWVFSTMISGIYRNMINMRKIVVNSQGL